MKNDILKNGVGYRVKKLLKSLLTLKLKKEHIFLALTLGCGVLIVYLDNLFLEIFWLFCYSVWLLLYYNLRSESLIEWEK